MDVCERIASGGYRVAVLCGGSGSERAVSLVSGRAVAGTLSERGVPTDLLEMEKDALPDGLSRSTHLILPIVHGTYGEDGRLSADLDRGGFLYAGCEQAASVVCFDKLACKAIAAHLGLPMAKDRYLPQGDAPAFDEMSVALGLPFILKPRWDGSSVGLHLVRDAAQYEAAMADLARTDYLAEEYLDGYDLTVGVLGGQPLGVVGVRPKGGLYDYAHKYTSGMSEYEVPARLEARLVTQLQEWTRLIFQACGCRDLARVDYRIGHDGRLVFLEVNTLPGMTSTSLLPKSAQCKGMSFHDLVLNWVQFALDRAGGAA